MSYRRNPGLGNKILVVILARRKFLKKMTKGKKFFGRKNHQRQKIFSGKKIPRNNFFFPNLKGNHDLLDWI
jgi:hypothetical protein